jgi:uncharacterized membrane protein YgdD (TMEM256/DUF423 family)
LLGVALLAHRERGRAVAVAGTAFATGVLLFTGSLWALVLCDAPVLGAITPFGGVALLVGWVALGAAAWGAAR